MANYPLEKLNDKEFEDLTRDILQKEMGIPFESFRKGRDRGIDLRYSNDVNSASIIVQAKHYKGSGFRKLLEVLRKEELPKIHKLKPSRYIVVTSVPLNPEEKQNIMNVFPGYIHNTPDIFGEDDINNSIARFPEILRSHPKLYLASLDVLSHVINAHIHSRSLEKIKVIQSRIHLFIPNEKYQDAIEIINDSHFLIITGEPGIGKTSLANFIAFQHLADGFRFTYILSDLTDAEKLLADEEKEFFYFDDFLGANYLRIKHHPHQDAMLLNFISRIKASKNKRLILTTRTTILNQARSDFEKLKNPVLDLSRHEIHIADYNNFQKAQILYNHIYHSGLGLPFLQNFIDNKTYRSVIAHPNYNPRLIEYITDIFRLKNIAPDSYHAFILEKLNKPHDIWRDPYDSQIDDAAKFLLQTLFTLPARTPEQQVHEAFNERIKYEVQENGFQKSSNLFQRTLYDLLGGFIHRRTGAEASYLEFYNPSFADFMSSYLSANEEEATRLLNGILYTDQFRHAFTLAETIVDPESHWLDNIIFSGFYNFRSLEKVKIPRRKLMSIVRARLDFLKPLNINKSRELDLCAFLLEHFSIADIKADFSTLYPYINIAAIHYHQFEDLLILFKILDGEDKELSEIIKRDFEKLAWKLFQMAEDERDFLKVRKLFDQNGMSYSVFREKYGSSLQSLIDSFWENGEIESRLNDEDLSQIYDEQTMLNKLNEMEADASSLNDELELDPSPGFKDIFNWDYEAAIRENRNSKEGIEYQAPVLPASKAGSTDSQIDPIEDLFDNLLNTKTEKSQL